MMRIKAFGRAKIFSEQSIAWRADKPRFSEEPRLGNRLCALSFSHPGGWSPELRLLGEGDKILFRKAKGYIEVIN